MANTINWENTTDAPLPKSKVFKNKEEMYIEENKIWKKMRPLLIKKIKNFIKTGNNEQKTP
jgi:hypothetical protein